MTHYTAPDGSAIKGTAEVIEATSHVQPITDPNSYSHEGDSDVYWDTSETKTIDGVSLMCDEGAEEWLQHHLIPWHADHDGLSAETLALCRREIAEGRVLEATVQLRAALDHMIADHGSHHLMRERIWAHEEELRKDYRHTRDEVKAAIAAELAAR